MMELIALVKRATQGDAAAFGELVTQHWRFVYTMCLSHVGHAAEAEDLTQEVFVRVAHDLKNLREPAKFLRWLQQVARNMCRMWHRRQRETVMPVDAMAALEDPAAVARLRRSELGEIVGAMLAQVSPKSREVLALHYLAGYSEAELAVAFGVSPATVKSRLHEAREQAKRKLLPIVRELLSLQPRSAQLVEPTMPRYGKSGCPCARALTDRR
jgi:RNA polymerase sigma-70 factor (ECF subfamily)